MLVFVVLAVFIAGLMVGRTPEYLGKKIQAYDVKMAMLALLVLCRVHPRLHRLGRGQRLGRMRRASNNTGPHGFSEILYAYSSGTGNNGSAFAGLTANPADGDPHYNVTLGLAMLIGRFLMIVPIMALAGSLVQKKIAPPSAGTFPVSGGTFAVLLIGTVLLIGALNFLPALALGPIVEHFLMLKGHAVLISILTRTSTSNFPCLTKLHPSLTGTSPVPPSATRSRSSIRASWSRTRSCSSPWSARC